MVEKELKIDTMEKENAVLETHLKELKKLKETQQTNTKSLEKRLEKLNKNYE